MDRLYRLNKEKVRLWTREARRLARDGSLPDYIPYLSRVDPDNFAFSIYNLDGEVFTIGNERLPFPLMSVIKPVLLLYLLETVGQEIIFQKVGRSASDYPFNSLEQLLIDKGFPRNPMLNSGAIALADLLPGNYALERCHSLMNWLVQKTDSNLYLNLDILRSVESLPNITNQKIAVQLHDNGYLDTPELALDTYQHICCIAGNIKDLASLGLLILNSPPYIRDIVLEIMGNCGLYEASLEMSSKVKLPTKSGVSGVILSILPFEGVIACYSPKLDKRGNSIAGLFLLEKIGAIVG